MIHPSLEPYIQAERNDPRPPLTAERARASPRLPRGRCGQSGRSAGRRLSSRRRTGPRRSDPAGASLRAVGGRARPGARDLSSTAAAPSSGTWTPTTDSVVDSPRTPGCDSSPSTTAWRPNTPSPPAWTTRSTRPYVHAHRASSRIRGLELILMGDSAGATLITVACASTRGDGTRHRGPGPDLPDPRPAATDRLASHRSTRASSSTSTTCATTTASTSTASTDQTDPRVSPMMCEDLAGSPPAIVVVAECDPLRDEGVAYAGLLEHFEVPVELLEAKGMPTVSCAWAGWSPPRSRSSTTSPTHLDRRIDAAP